MGLSLKNRVVPFVVAHISDITPKPRTGPLSEVIASRFWSDTLDNVYDCLAVREWTSFTHVWTFAQNTAPAPAGLSTQDTLPEPRVGLFEYIEVTCER